MFLSAIIALAALLLLLLLVDGEGLCPSPSPMAGWCNGNMAASSTVAVGSSPAPAPISRGFFMNESTALFFLAGLLVGLVVFDFVMLFFYILV